MENLKKFHERCTVFCNLLVKYDKLNFIAFTISRSELMEDVDIVLSKESNPKKFLEEEYLSAETRVCFLGVALVVICYTHARLSNFHSRFSNFHSFIWEPAFWNFLGLLLHPCY